MIRAILKNMKLVHWLAIAVVILLACVYFLSRSRTNLRSDVERLGNNIGTLTEDLWTEKTKSGDLMYQTGILVMERNEIKRYYEDDVLKELKNVSVRLKRLESISNTTTESTHIIETTIRDSIRLVDGVEDENPLRIIEYKSEWLDFSQVSYLDHAKTTIVKRDSLIQVVYWPTKEGFFLFRIFKKKPPLEQKIRSADPNSIITYSRFIKPVKKRID